MMKNEKGQSTIEFIISFAFAVSFILMVFNVSLNYATGYVVHYATFMASRTYLTADGHTHPDNRGEARNRAEDTFKKYTLTAFGVPNNSFSIHEANSSAVTPGQYLMIGGLTKYQKDVDVIGRVVGNSKIDLISESFLGREPTRSACAKRICYALTGSEESCATGSGRYIDVTLFDNGC